MLYYIHIIANLKKVVNHEISTFVERTGLLVGHGGTRGHLGHGDRTFVPPSDPFPYDDAADIDDYAKEPWDGR